MHMLKFNHQCDNIQRSGHGGPLDEGHLAEELEGQVPSFLQDLQQDVDGSREHPELDAIGVSVLPASRSVTKTCLLILLH